MASWKVLLMSFLLHAVFFLVETLCLHDPQCNFPISLSCRYFMLTGLSTPAVSTRWPYWNKWGGFVCHFLKILFSSTVVCLNTDNMMLLAFGWSSGIYASKLLWSHPEPSKWAVCGACLHRGTSTFACVVHSFCNIPSPRVPATCEIFLQIQFVLLLTPQMPTGM